MSSKEKIAYRAPKGFSTKRATSLAGFQKLLLGPDHLLFVFVYGYTETYKRIYYRDIQATIVRRTLSGAVITTILGALAALFLALLLDYDASFAITGLTFLIFFIALAVHLAMGSTCVCHIRTAVQNERLPTLVRLPAARKALGEITALASQAQADELGPDAMIARIHAVSEETLIDIKTEKITEDSARRARKNHAAHVGTDAKKKTYNGWGHRSLFTCLLLSPIILICNMFLKVNLNDSAGIKLDVLGVLSALLMLALIASILWALIGQAGTAFKKELKILTWCAAVFYSIKFFVTLPLISIAMLDGVQLNENPYYYIIEFISAAVSLLLGLLGWIGLAKEFSTQQRSQSPGRPADRADPASRDEDSWRT